MNEALGVINTNDATIVGILLSFIIVLLFAFSHLWKRYQKELEYSKEQDKENLLIMAKITETVSDVARQGERRDVKIDRIKEDSSNILSIILERLKKF